MLALIFLICHLLFAGVNCACNTDDLAEYIQIDNNEDFTTNYGLIELPSELQYKIYAMTPITDVMLRLAACSKPMKAAVYRWIGGHLLSLNDFSSDHEVPLKRLLIDLLRGDIPNAGRAHITWIRTNHPDVFDDVVERSRDDPLLWTRVVTHRPFLLLDNRVMRCLARAMKGMFLTCPQSFFTLLYLTAISLGIYADCNGYSIAWMGVVCAMLVLCYANFKCHYQCR